MDWSQLFVQLVIALVCAGAANMLVPRQIPGKIAGLVLIGLAGVWLGDWGYQLLQQQYGIQAEWLEWQVRGVLIAPAILGSAIVLYLLTSFLKWGRYT